MGTRRRLSLPLLMAAGWLLAAWPVSPCAADGGAAPASQVPDAGVKAEAERARSCFERARAAYQHGRLEAARRGFECAYRIFPSAELAWNLARVFERMGDVEHGIRYYRDYLARAHADARERRAVQARIDGLLELQARQAVQPKPSGHVGEAMSGEARKFFERGVKLYRMRHYAAAQAAFAAALQFSKAPELQYNLALTAERQGALREAIDHYTAYLASEPAADDRGEVVARIAQLRTRLP